MFTINQQQSQSQNSDRVPEQTGNIPPASDNNATQRVSVGTERPPQPPQRRTPQPAANRRATPPPVRKPAVKKPKEKILIFILLGIAAILLVSVVITAAIMLRKPSEDGLIPNNVFAAGVNLGGMTEERAKQALTEATANTYTQLEMTIQVLDTTITLSPKDTGARLDVDAVVAAAMTGNAPGTVSVLPYLNLDTNYIRAKVDELGSKYSSTLTQGTVTLEGTKPTITDGNYDTETAFQTLVVYVGTAEYGLNTDALYDQILDAYDINLFHVVAECSVIAPDPLNLSLYYEQIKEDPVDAFLDTTTYVVTKEIYGYGFDLAKATEQVAAAQYGETVRIPIYFIQPDITEEMLTSDLFRDVLADCTTVIGSDDPDLLLNLSLACNAINGQLIKAGENFSFWEMIQNPIVRGYKSIEIFVGTEREEVVGGGISQVATTLYNCALLSDLSILERHAHAYAPDYVKPGLDAMVSWGSADLSFSNSTNYPIRIEAQIVDECVVIRFIGTDTNDYFITLETEVVEHAPTTLHQAMREDNSAGLVEGDVLVEGITGYDVIVYCNLVEKETHRTFDTRVQNYMRYEKRNEVVVSFYVPPVVPDPDPSTDPTGTTPPTDPAGTTPSTTPAGTTPSGNP